MTDAKRRAQEGLSKLVDEALDTMRLSITGKMMMVRGSTRTSDARFVLSAVLERLPDASAASSSSTMSADELAAKREQLRLARLAERKQA